MHGFINCPLQSSTLGVAAIFHLGSSRKLLFGFGALGAIVLLLLALDAYNTWVVRRNFRRHWQRRSGKATRQVRPESVRKVE